MIRTLLIDLGKVIVPFDFSVGYRAMQARCGLPPEVLRERIRATGLVPQFETGLMESRDFVERICGAVGMDIGYDEFCEIWSSIFERRTLIPDHLLAALHAHYRLVLVSNTNAIHFNMVRENYPILRHFDAYILSYEVKAMKPSAVIFEAAIAAAQCRPEECFFTDDIAEYIDAAKSCGIDAVQFQECAQWERELQARGVAWSD